MTVSRRSHSLVLTAMYRRLTCYVTVRLSLLGTLSYDGKLNCL